MEDNCVRQMVAQGMLGKLGCSVNLAEDEVEKPWNAWKTKTSIWS